MEKLTEQVEQWAIDRELEDKDPLKQIKKTMEEVMELQEAVIYLQNGYDNDLSDDYVEKMVKCAELEMGDIAVTLIVLCLQLEIDFKQCLQMAYDKIKDRKGKTIDGVFVKEEDLK